MERTSGHLPMIAQLVLPLLGYLPRWFAAIVRRNA